MTRIYKTPFAATGDKEPLATADQPDGKVSLQAGWTPDYELPNDNANYRPVGRAEMNGILNELTDAIGEMQQNGFAVWAPLDGGWPINAIVLTAGTAYRSLTSNNTETPSVTATNWRILFNFPMSGTSPSNWAQVALVASPTFTGEPKAPTAVPGTSNTQLATTAFVAAAVTAIPAATETTSGLLRIATAAQAQATLDDTTALTPKKLVEAFAGANRLSGSNGFQRLGGVGGFMLQWGETTLTAGVSKVVTLPQAFQSAFFQGVACPGADLTGAEAEVGVLAGTTTTITLRSDTGVYARYLAIGF